MPPPETYGAPTASGYGIPAAPPPPPGPVGPPPPPPGPGGTIYQRAGGANNLLGWLALIFGIIGTGCCCCPWLNGAPFIGGIPAIVLGVMHLSKVKKGQATMAWLGWVAIALGVIAIIGAICGLATNWQDRIYNRVPSSPY